MSNIQTESHKNCCIKSLKWIPVFFVLIIISWSYYAYVYGFCILTVDSTSIMIIFLVFYQILFFMMLWSYIQTIFTKPAAIPEEFKLPPVEYELLDCAGTFKMRRQILENFAQNLPVINRTSHGTVRYCEKCRLIKPDRAHHCSVCEKCILKMDHHCPWINNCVSFTNYKCFFLFLTYSFLYTLYISATTFPFFIDNWKSGLATSEKFNIVLLFVVALMFAISLITLLIYHCYLVVINRSTLESFRAPIFQSGSNKNAYNIGCCTNLKEVFGDNFILWIIPVRTSRGDGVVFPMRGSQHKWNSYNSMRNGKV